MLASILIIGFSLALLIYWFRYSCILLLRNQSELSSSQNVIDPRFHIGEIQDRLNAGEQLDPLHGSLQRDYEVLIYLLEHAPGLELQSIEERLLVIDYKVMGLWYGVTRSLAPVQARQALSEMASVVRVLVERMAERAGVEAEA